VVYFSITVLYDGHSVKKAGNSISLTMPESSPEDYASTSISGYISEDGKIRLSWGEITSDGFDGYKVMYSFTDPTPVYGESGCNYYDYITDASTTSCSFYPAAIGASSGQVVYFSISVLYDGHTVKKAGNSISLTMPSESEPTPEP
jgi:hypothetical protein